MQILASYLADYIDHEAVVCCPANKPLSTVKIHELIERGLEAYQSTEDCIVSIAKEEPEPK